MTALFGGIVALVLGVVLLLEWWQSFLHILQGSIPVLLLAGGGLATYLGGGEVREAGGGPQRAPQPRGGRALPQGGRALPAGAGRPAPGGGAAQGPGPVLRPLELFFLD